MGKIIDKKRLQKWHVTLAMEDRAFGGPEEGGWWYDTVEPLESELNRTFWNEDLAEKYLKYLGENVIPKYNEGRYPTSSVLSRGIYAVYISLGPLEPYPTHRPVYC